MGFFDSVSEFFGVGEAKKEEPISVPLPQAVDSPAVHTAQARFSAATAHLEEVKAQKKEQEQLAEGKASAQWMKDVAKAEHDVEQKRAEYEREKYKPDARTKPLGQPGNLYDDQIVDIGKQLGNVEFKLKSIQDFHSWQHQNPISKFMDPAFEANLAAAEREASIAQMELNKLQYAQPRAAG
jgi:hypothetical protein